MAAPDLETLFDFETNIELAAQSFLGSALGVSVGIFRSLEQDEFLLPRVHVNLELGEALDPPGERSDIAGRLGYVKYAATLVVVIASDGTAASSEVEHRSLRSKARASLEIAATNWDMEVSGDPVLPYYEVNYMRPAGTLYDADGDILTSELSYQLFLSIKDDAWPVEDEGGE